MTIKKRGTTWQYDFYHNDKRYRKSGFKTKREAVAAESKVMTDLGKGLNLDNNIVFHEYFRKWVEVNKKDLSESGLRLYRTAADTVEKYFGNEKIKDVTRMKYQAFLNWYGTEAPNKKRYDNKGHSHQSSKMLNNKVRACVNYAIYDGVIYKDFTYKATLSYVSKPMDKSMKFLELEEFKKLKDIVTSDNDIYNLYLFLMMVTGGRFSDIQKLRYEHIDQVNNELFLPGYKNENAERTVKIAANDMRHLNKVIESRPRNLSGYIFKVMAKAGFIQSYTINKYLKRMCPIWDIRTITSHALRHTHCSILILEGVDIYYISERMGHKNIQTTQNIYAHLLDAGHDKAEEITVNALAAL